MSRKRLPIFHKLSKLLKVFIFIAKIRKLSFENSLLRKSRNLKKLKLMKHYNYGYLGEYEFSPSNTPLIHYHRRQFMKNSKIPQDMYSMLFLCRCWGSLRVLEGNEDGVDCTMESRPLPLPLPASGDHAKAVALLEPLDWGVDDEEASIDLRAQRFIERFYEDMRMQRQEYSL